MTWDIQHRPLTFSDVLGQEGTVQVLRSRLRNGTALGTSYILSGGHGRGKTTIARILGRALLCSDLQEDGEPCNRCDNCQAVLTETSVAYTEIDAASKGTIDNVRRIVEELDFVIPGAPKRVYVLDEMHRMSRDSQDVLLKPLEDKKFVCIFCTTEPARIRATIRSRCEEYPIRKVTREAIFQRVKRILEKEGVGYEEDALLTVIDHSGGHVRDVINRLEMISQLGRVDIETVREYLNLSVISTFYKILLSLGDPGKAVPMVEAACDQVGPEEVSSGLAEAAMSSFRLAHGLFTEFTYVDRKLAKNVHDLYGDDVVRLAQYFLRASKVTRVGLVCDVVRCSGGVPDESPSTSKSPPVLVQATAPVSQKVSSVPEPVVEGSSEPSEPVSETVLPEKGSEPASPDESGSETVPEPEKPSLGDNGLRSDGIGDLGSEDALALTREDRKGVPLGHPRGSVKAEGPKAEFKGSHGKSQESELITWEKWERVFALMWSHQGG